MKTSIVCGFLILAAICGAEEPVDLGRFGPIDEHIRLSNNSSTGATVVFHGVIGGDWLVVKSNETNSGRGFDPGWISIESKYKPVVKETGDTWKIVFVSKTGEKLP